MNYETDVIVSKTLAHPLGSGFKGIQVLCLNFLEKGKYLFILLSIDSVQENITTNKPPCF